MSTHDDLEVADTGIDHAKLDAERLAYIEANLVPGIKKLFADHPWMRSVAMLVAQYWDDEADDAVHCLLVTSQLERPDLEAYFGADYENDPVNHPADLTDDMFWKTWEARRGWDDNYAAIPLFAAFCPEGGSQDRSYRENYRPYALFQRDGDNVKITVVGQMLRPWLDGVTPNWED